MIAAITSLGVLTIFLGVGLAYAQRYVRPIGTRLVDAIDVLLPQTQCERCGYPGCRPYAEAVASGTAINRCPPGGTTTIDALAALLDRPVLPLDPELRSMHPNGVAFIDESRCIGCALCLPACPVDAIVGASGHMHTVVAADCTGCELCVPVCPVDCISMETSRIIRDTVDFGRANTWRRRFEGHTRRAAERARAAEARRQERQSRISTRRNWDDA
jgi:electron transport complex protein RnfB